jgi:hypothetical protein
MDILWESRGEVKVYMYCVFSDTAKLTKLVMFHTTMLSWLVRSV